MKYLDVSVISIILLFPSLWLFLLAKRKSGHQQNKSLPPGQTGWFLIGESLEFLSTGRQGRPEKFIFDRTSIYSSNIFTSSLFGEKTIVLCGATNNKFLFTNENKLVQSWWPNSVNKLFPSTTETSSKEESIKMRKMLPSFFKPEALQRYVGIMDEIAQKHFNSCWENKSKVIVAPLAKRFTFLLACRLFLGLEDPDHIDQFAQPFNLLASGVFSIPINLPGTVFNRAIKASNIIRKTLLGIIKKKKVDLENERASATQDILSHMLLTSDETGKLMTESNIADKILGLLIGGHDTASSACSSIVMYLAQLPHIYAAVHKEQMEIATSKTPGELLNWDDLQKMKYSWNVACEVLRLAPPLQGSFREVLSDFTYNGFFIPKGWKIYWSANSTHKSAEYFPEPEEFDPSRFQGSGPAPYTFVPFGGGPRMCPGKEYGRLEILVFMHHLVKRFRWEKLIPEEKITVNPLPFPEKDLPIRLFPHHF